MRTTKGKKFEVITGDVFELPGNYDALIVPGQVETDWKPWTGLGVEAEVYKRLSDPNQLLVQRELRDKNEGRGLNIAECWTAPKFNKSGKKWINGYNRLIFVAPPKNKTSGCEVQLYMCYYNAFMEAINIGAQRIICPLLGSGRNDFSEEMSLYVAEEAYVNLISVKEEAQMLKIKMVKYDGVKPRFEHGKGENKQLDYLLKNDVKVLYKPEVVDWHILFEKKKIFLRDQGLLVQDIYDGTGLALGTCKKYLEKSGSEVIREDRKSLIEISKGLQLSANQVNALLRSTEKLEELTEDERRTFIREKYCDESRKLISKTKKKEVDVER